MRRKVNQTVTGQEIGVDVGDNSDLMKGFYERTNVRVPSEKADDF